MPRWEIEIARAQAEATNGPTESTRVPLRLRWSNSITIAVVLLVLTGLAGWVFVGAPHG